MAKLNLDKFQLLWFCDGFIGKSHLRWDGYQTMVDKVFPQLSDNEREFIYTYAKRDFKWHWESKKFRDETPYRYWLQMLARFNLGGSSVCEEKTSDRGHRKFKQFLGDYIYADIDAFIEENETCKVRMKIVFEEVE